MGICASEIKEQKTDENGCKVKVKLEKSDEKGMLNSKAIMKFLAKAIKAICKIDLPIGFGSGFFCKIPYMENNNTILLSVLITCHHVLSSDYLNSENYIKITVDDETKNISLKQRKKWTNESMDFACIEIKEEEDNIHSFFYLDDNALDNNSSNECFLKQNVLIYGFNKNENGMQHSNGLIIKNIDSFSFEYNCNTYSGCSGGCIVNQYNNCVVGIHQGSNKTENEKIVNIGIYIKNIIKSIQNYKESSLSNVIFIIF